MAKTEATEATEAAEPGPVFRRTDVIEHREGCPATRLETIESRRPSTGELVRVERCIECAEQTAKVVEPGSA